MKLLENCTQEQREAINILRTVPEILFFLKAIEDEQKRIDIALRTAPIENVPKLQGKAIALQDVSSFLTK